jgi:sulfotransferase family protein
MGLEKFDDPWGLTWRITNALVRVNPARTARFLSALLRGGAYSRPIFIIGVPRSGTTMIFRLLRNSLELAGMTHEGHDLWRRFHHPRLSGWRSDVVGRGAVRWGERRFAAAFISSRCQSTASRFVEKTPDNSLRIGYLLDLFPDAIVVVVKRNPCDVISSLIDGWRDPAGRFRAYYVPAKLSIPDYPYRHRWCFTLIEGWRDLISAPIPAIAFAQWYSISKAIEKARPAVPSSQWIEIRLEDLLDQPESQLQRLCEGVGIHDDPDLYREMRNLIEHPANALSAPRFEKWRTRNPEEIQALLPRIARVAPEFGYSVDESTGAFRIVP